MTLQQGNAVPGEWAAGTSAVSLLTRRVPTQLILVGGLLTVLGTSNATAWLEREPIDILPQTTTGLCVSTPEPVEHTARFSPETGWERTEGTRMGIHELRRLSGLTWEQLARLCGVTRRALHFWASGKPLKAVHEERLQRLLATVRLIDRGSALDNRRVLLQPGADGILPFDLLIDGEYDAVVKLLGPGEGARAKLARTPLSPEARAARSLPPPADLVGALQDRVHRDVGKARLVRALRTAQ